MVLHGIVLYLSGMDFSFRNFFMPPVQQQAFSVLGGAQDEPFNVLGTVIQVFILLIGTESDNVAPFVPGGGHGCHGEQGYQQHH